MSGAWVSVPLRLHLTVGDVITPGEVRPQPRTRSGASRPACAQMTPEGQDCRAVGAGTSGHLFLSVILLQVGLDPRRDVHCVTYPPIEAMRLRAEGNIDALLNIPPIPQELRTRKIGLRFFLTTPEGRVRGPEYT